MRIANSTCCHEKALFSNNIIYTAEEAMIEMKKAGFHVVDMNFASYSRNNGPMTQDNYLDWCKEQKKIADDLSLSIDLAHAHFYHLNEHFEEDPKDRMLIERSIEGAGIMKVEWMVFHPFQVEEDGWYSHEKSLQTNLKLFREYAELCRPLGVKIAIENMIGNKKRGRRYCSNAEELIELVDTLNDDIFGICWDFGHANLNGNSQTASLKKIGKRLKTLHVDDNFGQNDDHVCPYFGTIQWAPIMKTLKEIGYDGDFTYEIFHFYNGLPSALQPLTLSYTYKVAEYLLSLAK